MQGAEQLNTDSLFDFLYVDRIRLAALVAQLTNSGVLQSTEHLDSTVGKSGGGVELKIPALGGSLTGSSEVTSSIKQQFDASWSLPLNALDLLDEFGFLHKTIAEAQLGDIFVAAGGIRFLDYRLLQNCWEPIVDHELASQGHQLKSAQKTQLKSIFRVIEKLPHSLELIIHTGEETIWTSPRAEFMTIQPDTLTCSHGSSIPGQWHIVAILDGLPASRDSEFSFDFLTKPMVKELQVALAQMNEGLRAMLGRPYEAYAATPLLIFRKVSKPQGRDQGTTELDRQTEALDKLPR